MPHQRSSADGDPSSSGRYDARSSGSGDLQLRSDAQLPRNSHNGSESLPSQQAEDALLQNEQAARRATNLKARAPNSEERVNSITAGRKARRGSIADFLGLRSGAPSRDTSAAPSRDITLQGMAIPPSSGARSRRASLLNSFGFGLSQPAAPGNNYDAAGAEMDTVDLGKSLQQQQERAPRRRRRASMLDIFRPMQSSIEATSSTEGGDGGAPLELMPHSKSQNKSRRMSVIDFFRSSNTGFTTGEDLGLAMSRGRLSRGESGAGSRSNRRRSVIHILGNSSKKVGRCRRGNLGCGCAPGLARQLTQLCREAPGIPVRRRRRFP